MSRIAAIFRKLFATRRARLAAFVVVLTAVIFVMAALSQAPRSGDRDTTTRLPDGETRQGAEQMPLEGEEATRAIIQGEGGRRTAGDGRPTGAGDPEMLAAGAATTPGEGDTAAPGEWEAPVDDISALLPEKVDGLSRGSVTKDEFNAVVPFDPVAGGPYAGARRVLMSVRYADSVEVARSYRDQVSKVVYPKNSAAVTVQGINGYFGTDGRSLATVSFTRGRFVFEVVVTAIGDPAALKDAALRIASTFPTEVQR
ncbi:MAG: hypothetical protein KGZ89_04355 [Actinobacteria bacterium]|nr:hypothetical protein [Actinomycetota bacterium]